MTVRGGTGWDAHPGVRPGNRAAAAGISALLVIGLGAALIIVPVAVVALGLATLALVGVLVLLLAVRHHDRVTSEVALYDLDQSRRFTAVAEDLRAEVRRLHDDLARITTQTERLGRARKEDS